MEEEEKAAQSAKLQELIRRGGPEDLQEANRLMKVMAGYDTRQKTDYRAKAAEEVGKVQQKARLLEERLEEFKPGDVMVEGDVYEELASALQSAHPKIQRMCEEESDDHAAVAKLLEINDSIHRTVERYKLMKKGDVDAASRIAKGTLGTSTGVSKNADNELSLIDFEPEAEASTNGGSSTAAPGSSSGGLEDDLLGLSMTDNSYGQGGGISLGFGNNTSKFIFAWGCKNVLTSQIFPDLPYYRQPANTALPEGQHQQDLLHLPPLLSKQIILLSRHSVQHLHQLLKLHHNLPYFNSNRGKLQLPRNHPLILLLPWHLLYGQQHLRNLYLTSAIILRHQKLRPQLLP
jgi:hypothetical protein